MILARPFKVGNDEGEMFRRRIAMVEISIVADATEYWVGIGNRGLKATAKVMPTLRVEDRATLPPF
jgi:hypothetical protein